MAANAVLRRRLLSPLGSVVLALAMSGAGCACGKNGKGSSSSSSASSAASSTTGSHSSSSSSSTGSHSTSTSGSSSGSSTTATTGTSSSSSSSGSAGTTGSTGSSSTGSTGSTGSSGTTGTTAAICAPCTQDSDCASGYCNTVDGPTNFCDTASQCTNVTPTPLEDCSPATCNESTGVCNCFAGSTGSTTGSTGTTGVATSGSSGTSGSGSSSSSSTGTSGSSGSSGGQVGIANDPSTFVSPFDAVADATGAVYFTGIAPGTGQGALFKVVPPLRAVSQLASGLTLPLAVASPAALTDTNVYIADPAGALGGPDDLGGLYAVSKLGGTPTLIAGTGGYKPRALTVRAGTGPGGTDELLFTGDDPASGVPGVFSVPPTGGSVTTLLSGDPLVDPSGLAIDANGNIYVADSSGPGHRGAVLAFTSGGASVLAGNLLLGYPAGLAVSASGTSLFVSGRSAADGTDLVYTVTLASGAVATSAPGIGTYLEAGGLRGAAGGTVTFVDGAAGSSGAVFQFTP